MKFFILIILFPLNLFAISVSDVCTNVASRSVGEALRCNEILSEEHFFDPSAVVGCHQMSHWTAKGAVDCLIAISDKVYPNQTAKTCVELARNRFKAIECFERSGRPYREINEPCNNPQSVLTKINNAKNLILNQNYQSAYRQLTLIEDEILNCRVK